MKAHLINCTYCIFRQISADPKRKNGERELCKITYQPIKHPNEPGRYCEEFHQEGHDCLDCVTVADAWNERITK